MTDQPRWPLEGVKVLDLGQIYNGPYAGFLLAHAGADVVKIEPLGSEVLRKRGGLGVPFSLTMLNTNKRGLAIDLKHPDGKQFALSSTNRASNGNGRRLDKEGNYVGNYSPVHVMQLPA